MEKVTKSKHVYIIHAHRNSSQFNQLVQKIRCHALDARRGHILVESLKRYNLKYPEAVKTATGPYRGMPVRRINRDQILKIIDEKTGCELSWETIRRREGSQRTPGRARGGK